METRANPLIQVKLVGLTGWESGVDEILVAEAASFGGRFSSFFSPSSPFGSPCLGAELSPMVGPSLGSPVPGLKPLRLMLQDGRMVDLMGKAPIGNELGLRQWGWRTIMTQGTVGLQ